MANQGGNILFDNKVINLIDNRLTLILFYFSATVYIYLSRSIKITDNITIENVCYSFFIFFFVLDFQICFTIDIMVLKIDSYRRVSTIRISAVHPEK